MHRQPANSQRRRRGKFLSTTAIDVIWAADRAGTGDMAHRSDRRQDFIVSKRQRGHTGCQSSVRALARGSAPTAQRRRPVKEKLRAWPRYGLPRHAGSVKLVKRHHRRQQERVVGITIALGPKHQAFGKPRCLHHTRRVARIRHARRTITSGSAEISACPADASRAKTAHKPTPDHGDAVPMPPADPAHHEHHQSAGGQSANPDESRMPASAKCAGSHPFAHAAAESAPY